MKALLLERLMVDSRHVSAGYAESGKQYSLLEYLLWETEQMHGRIRRYTSPDEHAFFPRDLPPLVLPPIQYLEASLTDFGSLAHQPTAQLERCKLHRSKSLCCNSVQGVEAR